MTPDSNDEPAADATGEQRDDTDDAEHVLHFDADETTIRLSGSDDVSAFDVQTLEDTGVLSIETADDGDDTVVTECEINPEYLRLMATEFNTVERSLGERFDRTKWRPDIRLRL